MEHGSKCSSFFVEVDVELFDIETKGSNNYHTDAPVEHTCRLSILKACFTSQY